MLRKNLKFKSRSGGGQFCVVASRYNAVYVDAMLQSAVDELKRAGASRIEVVRVPGAFEIPIIAARLAGTHAFSGIICLGVILRGKTVHADYIGRTVTEALMKIQLRYGVPVIHEVLLLESEAQARVRCFAGKFSRGTEAAQTALEMARVMLDYPKGSRLFSNAWTGNSPGEGTRQRKTRLKRRA